MTHPGKSRRSAGILPFRTTRGTLEVLLVHPGGPFWAAKDLGAWSIPKGEYEPNEDPLSAACRELAEETGLATSGPFVPLTGLRQPSGKVIDAWAVETDFDPATLHSNTFTLEWPKGSGRQREFPEVDRAAWFPCDQARERILAGQRGFVDQVCARAGETKLPSGVTS
jgi:predicted NUDIX family NTP pyrophosphohydrolase